MILYCIVCYLIVTGMLIDEHSNIDDWSGSDVFFFLIAPITAPIFIGMHINGRTKHEK